MRHPTMFTRRAHVHQLAVLLCIIFAISDIIISNNSIHAFTPSISSNKIINASTQKTTLQSTTSNKIDNNPTTTTTPEVTTKKRWFPTKPEEALLTQYDTIVRGAYVRHVVLETEDMVDLATQTYLKGGTSATDDDCDNNGNSGGAIDPFGKLAKDLSACLLSKEENGKIGWIHNPFHPSYYTNTNNNADNDDDDNGQSVVNNNDAVEGLISHYAIQELFRAKPKGGDILKLSSFSPLSDDDGNDDTNDGNQKWHLCRIDDLLIDYIPNTKDLDNDENKAKFDFKQQGVNKVITSRPKLKGLGVVPNTPTIVRPNTNDESNTKNNDNDNAKTYHIATSGCQMNVADSERLAGVLQNKLQLKPSTNPQNANIVILNTCSIRDHAEQKVYDTLGPYAARKRKGEPLALIVSGCVAQQEGEALLKRVPEVDLVMGPQYVNRLDDLLEDVSRGHQVVATDPTLLSEDLSRPIRGHDMRAWVNVIHGCNEHCTYCVVPGVRGVEQSRSMESMLEECLELAEAGYKEITLLGQNIDAYGRDMVPKRTFAELLHYLNDNIPDGTIERIRYVTSHPRYFSDRVIDAVATLDKVCECFHMPFQSGDDDVLRKMRRGYTFDSYMKIIDKIRAQSPDASICGDVIVGFPGETDAGFQRTLDLMEAVKFDNLNTFAYSPRPNTEAALWTNQVPEDVKAERLQIVQRLAAQHGMERSERYVGQTVEILVEDRNPRNVDQVMGRTRQNRQAFFDGDIEQLKGKTVNVLITEARPWSLVGKLA